MPGYLYDGGGSDESGLTVLVRLSAGYSRVQLVNRDGLAVWSSEVDSADVFTARVTGLSTFDVPLVLQSWAPVEVDLPGRPPAEQERWADVARLALPTVPWNMHIPDAPPRHDHPPAPLVLGGVSVAYLQAVPGRTAPIDRDVLAEVDRINGLADSALAALAALVKAKALRDVALSAAQAYGAMAQAAATILGSAMQAQAQAGGALSSRTSIDPMMGQANPTWADVISEFVSVGGEVGGGVEVGYALSNLADRLDNASRNNDAYLHHVGLPDVTGHVTEGILTAGPDYWSLRRRWLEATEQLFSLPNYLNPAWFKLRDVPVWTG
jgi:hypothetical protein